MGFSEKMKDSLGGDGARVLVNTNDAMVGRGTDLEVNVTVEGGNKPATVDALVMRVVEARRHWVDANGTAVAEADAAALDRRSLQPAWTQQVLSEVRVDVDQQVEPGQTAYLPVMVSIPRSAGRPARAASSPSTRRQTSSSRSIPRGTVASS